MSDKAFQPLIKTTVVATAHEDIYFNKCAFNWNIFFRNIEYKLHDCFENHDGWSVEKFDSWTAKKAFLPPRIINKSITFGFLGSFNKKYHYKYILEFDRYLSDSFGVSIQIHFNLMLF